MCRRRPLLSFLGSRMSARWQECWPRHENKSRERCGSSRIFFPRSDDSAVACFFSIVGQWLQWEQWPVLPVVAQRASPVNAHMDTCQSDGADLPPANLSCPEV